jgi:BirA family transcriptional regulator, biotin operon repressor / biotin---[acetyl-CoA-carboxylase] ligase
MSHTPVFSPGLAEQLYEVLAPLAAGKGAMSVEIVQSCDSTNTRLLERARLGDSAPALLIAEAQTGGRGRMGRSWLGESGDCLMFSLGLTMNPATWSGLSLVAGLEIATALHPDIRIKWPNDLWVGGAKLAGILIETANLPQEAHVSTGSRHVVVGCGINIRTPQVDSAALRGPATGLQALLPEATAASAIKALAAPLLQGLLAFETLGFAPWQERFAQRDALRGLEVNLIENERVTGMGQAAGVNADGALLVHTWDGMKEVSSGEVSVRPA